MTIWSSFSFHVTGLFFLEINPGLPRPDPQKHPSRNFVDCWSRIAYVLDALPVVQQCQSTEEVKKEMQRARKTAQQSWSPWKQCTRCQRSTVCDVKDIYNVWPLCLKWKHDVWWQWQVQGCWNDTSKMRWIGRGDWPGRCWQSDWGSLFLRNDD